MREQDTPLRGPLQRRDLLRDHPIFGLLGSELLEKLSARAIARKVKRGTTIFRKDDPGASLFAVCIGSVRISTASLDGKDIVLNVMNPGEVFGEIALLDGRPRTADATAITDCELLVIERRDFLPLVHDRPQVALKLVEILCARLRQTSQQVEDVMFLDLPARLAKTLIRLSKMKAPGEPAKIAITQRELSQLVGVSRESINKQLRDWERRRLIRIERGGLVVEAPSALTDIASGDENDND